MYSSLYIKNSKLVQLKENDINFLGEYKDNFKDIFFIGENNYKKFYKVHNIKEERDSCLKVIDKKKLEEGDYDFLLKQIQREEEITKLCKCENIVNIYDKFENENYIIFELELCDINLKKYISTRGAFGKNLYMLNEVILGVTKALKIMNEKGVIHRDIKPSNIFMKGKTQVKLGGFDYAIYIKDNNSEPIGTFFYTAPEIIKNLQYDEKCDLWSFGVTLYELLFGWLPYGKSVTPSIVKEIIYYEDNFNFGKTNIFEVNILFNKLLTINRKNRITHKEFFDFISEHINIFGMDKKSQLDSLKCSAINKRERVIKISLDDNFSYKDYETKDFINKIMNIVEEGYLPDIMNFPNGSIDSEQIHKYNNILYYDENIDFINSIHKDSDIFEKCTSGAFILCTNLESLELLKQEILKQFLKDKRTYFNLITTGSKCEKVMDFIKKEEEFENCIKNVCVYCMNLEKYNHLKIKYPKIHDDIYNKRNDVINFIKKFSSEKIKPYPMTKLVTYEEYIEKFKDRHLKISEFYGDFNPNIYHKSFNKIITLIDEESQKNELKVKNKDDLMKSLLIFNLKKDENEDIFTLDKLIIKEYTKNTFYGDLNKWLLNSKMNFYEPIAYFTARLMYSLNSYAKKKKVFYGK